MFYQKLRHSFRALSVVLFITAPCGFAVAEHKKPGLSVEDLISMKRFGGEFVGGLDGKGIYPSPNGEYLVIVTQHGDLETNFRHFEVSLLKTEASRNLDEPQLIAEFSNSKDRPGVGLVTWFSDNRLAFLAEPEDANRQIFVYDIEQGDRQKWSNSKEAVTVFGASQSSDVMVYMTVDPEPIQTDYSDMRDRGFVVPSNVNIGDLVKGDWSKFANTDAQRSFQRLHIIRDGQTSYIDLPDEDEIGVCKPTQQFINNGERSLLPSPDGSLALVRCRPMISPKSWKKYQDKTLQAMLARGGILAWWHVVDLASGDTWPLTGAPEMNYLSGLLPQWNDDSQSVNLIDEFLPVDGVSEQERERRYKKRFTAKIDVRTGQATELHTLPNEDSQRSSFRISEGLNDPWRLIAESSTDSVPSLVFDPNAALWENRQLADVKVHRWSDEDGRVFEAGIYFPIGYAEETRYPVVIQTHGFLNDSFEPEGDATTGYAAQPLAAAGIMVVQGIQCVENCDVSVSQIFTQAAEALIDSLDENKLIYRDRIALSGYSISCYRHFQFMTRSDYHIAAMTCLDGSLFGYMDYLFYGLLHGGQVVQTFEAKNGGPPFGDSIDKWLKNAATFNLHRIVGSPIQLTRLGNDRSGAPAILGAWEEFAALNLQDKPVELIMIPNALHNVVRPWPRWTTQQGAVDWNRYWLQGFERTRPNEKAGETRDSLAAQYDRWHALREKRDADIERAAR